MTKLVGVEGYALGQEIAVGDLGLEIGRQSSQTPQLRGDNWLSVDHARIAWSADGHLMIVDLNSTNGTFVNGRRINSTQVSPGDQIEVGSSVFRLDVTPRTQPRYSAVQADVAIAGSVNAHDGGIAVARDARDISSSSARADGYGFAVGRDYFEGDTIEFDPTGFRTARGVARLFLIIGTLVALVGFGLFGFMMIEAFGSFQEVMAKSAECEQIELGPEWAECHRNVGVPEIGFFPYGAAGAATMFAGIVIYTLGTMMNRSTDRREQQARRRARLAQRY